MRASLRNVRARSRRVARATAGGALTGIVTIMLAGCLPTMGGDAAAQREVVEEFFARLEAGDAEGAGELMQDPTLVTAGGLDNDFYGAARRPEDARIVGMSSFGGFMRANVEYTIDGEADPRTIELELGYDGHEPRVVAWDERLLMVPEALPPSSFRINGSTTVEPERYGQLVLLPGMYEFAYVDDVGISTIDPAGGESEPFALEFPLVDGATDVPDGVSLSDGWLRFDIEHRQGADEEFEDAFAPLLQQLIASCTAEGLAGPSCPEALVEDIEEGESEGQIDLASVEWTTAASYFEFDEGWKAVHVGVISFERGDRLQMVGVDIGGDLSRNEAGDLIITIDLSARLR